MSNSSDDWPVVTIGCAPSLKRLLMPMFLLAGQSNYLRADSLGFWKVGDDRHWIPRFHFQRTAVDKPRIRLAIFGVVHGDEAVGLHAILALLRHLEENPDLGEGYELFLYPVCNPGGFLAGTRMSPGGVDLNREFWKGSDEPEVKLLERELELHNFDGIISLHADDTSDGLYAYARGSVISRYLLVPALQRASQALPLNVSDTIDGFHAVGGIIHSCYDGILSAPPGAHPEAFEIIFETPQSASMESQTSAALLALISTLKEYREFISFAQGI